MRSKPSINSPTWAVLTFLLFAAIAPATSFGHALGLSYIWLQVNEDGMEGRIEIVADEYQAATGMMLAASTPLTERQRQEISRYIKQRFRVGHSGTDYPLTLESIEVTPIEDVAEYLIVLFRLDAPLPIPDELDIHYSAIMHELADHRGGFHIENNYKRGVEGNHSKIAVLFAPGRESATIKLTGSPVLQQLVSFIKEGVIHIWIGLDHVLFLITLLLPAVLIRRGREWTPTTTLKSSLWNVVAVVTVFTVAHSITLALAMKGWVELPSRFVESVIALSVLIVVIDNFFPVLGKAKWTTVFVFGLFHGLGFASVMEELALDFGSKLVALIGFNVGVELGQLAIVLVVFPIIYLLRRSNYVNMVLRPISGAIGLLALWWFVTRAFNLEIGFTSF